MRLDWTLNIPTENEKTAVSSVPHRRSDQVATPSLSVRRVGEPGRARVFDTFDWLTMVVLVCSDLPIANYLACTISHGALKVGSSESQQHCSMEVGLLKTGEFFGPPSAPPAPDIDEAVEPEPEPEPLIRFRCLRGDLFAPLEPLSSVARSYRERTRTHQDIVQLLRLFWSACPKDCITGGIDQVAFIDLYVKLAKLLLEPSDNFVQDMRRRAEVLCCTCVRV
jgi:hypothetical protein